MSKHETAQTVDLPVPPDLTGRADGEFSSLINRPLLPANPTEPPDRLGRPWRWAFAIRHRVDWLAVDRHHAVAMFSTSRYRPSPLPTEFVALREPGQLTTGRVRTVAEELEVGTRTVWQWAVGLVKDRLSR